MTGEPPSKTRKTLAQDLQKAQARLRAGRLRDAGPLVARVLAAEPDNAEAHHLAGLIHHFQGRPADALPHLERAARGLADQADPHVNLAVVLERLGRVKDAIGHYRVALGINPGSAVAWANLGFAYRRQGDFGQALDAFGKALDHEPGHVGAGLGFVGLLGGLRAEAPSPELEAALLRGFAIAGADPAGLAPAAAHQLGLKYGLAHGAAADDALDAAIEAIGGDGLFRTFLENAVNTDPAMERFLTGARRRLLLSGGTLDEAARATAAALAQQSELNEYVFFASDDEEKAVADLRTALETALASDAPDLGAIADGLLRFALYRPLSDLAGAGALADAGAEVLGPGVAALVRLTIIDRRAEDAIKASLGIMGAITDATSKAVRAQYEENPYPRWRRAAAQQPMTPAAKLAELFPHVTPPSLPARPDILIAGCGTGQHVVHVATTHPDAEIVALDLSLPSLAYARRMTDALAIGNVRFLQADILEAGGLERTFDMVQSVGVLHHMAEPLAGWRVLEGLLRPGGVMKIGLYSERGRRGVAECRKTIAAEGIASDPAAIRAFRRRLMDGPPSEAVAEVLETADFYTTSMCRDLLFHVQETGTTPARIKAMLAELGLEFIGFEGFEDAGVAAAYRQAHPADAAMTDLDAWDAFEAAEGPLTDLYLLWCLKPRPG